MSNSDTIYVFIPGTNVDLGNGLVGVVNQVNLTPKGVSYQVAWWDEASRCECWFYDHELGDAGHRPQPIGFMREGGEGEL